MDESNNIILRNISFEFGELIENLYLSKGYFHEVNGISITLKTSCNSIFNIIYKQIYY